MHGKEGSRCVTSSMRSPISRSSIPSVSASALLRSTSCSATICLRLNVSSCRVQLPRGFGGPTHFFDVRSSRVVDGVRVEPKFRVRPYDGQQIVEVMRDPAGEPADRFHFLRLTKLLFGHLRSDMSCRMDCTARDPSKSTRIAVHSIPEEDRPLVRDGAG